jgi:hypothetical protein
MESTLSLIGLAYKVLTLVKLKARRPDFKLWYLVLTDENCFFSSAISFWELLSLAMAFPRKSFLGVDF